MRWCWCRAFAAFARWPSRRPRALALADAGRAPRRRPTAALAANLTLATENLADHLTHFYLFFMPDFAREVYKSRAVPGMPRRVAALSCHRLEARSE
jgi:hypothetical protein